jgi:hypothetical protein
MLESAPDEICASPYGLGSDPVRTPSTVNALPGSRPRDHRLLGREVTRPARGGIAVRRWWCFRWSSNSGVSLDTRAALAFRAEQVMRSPAVEPSGYTKAGLAHSPGGKCVEAASSRTPRCVHGRRRRPQNAHGHQRAPAAGNRLVKLITTVRRAPGPGPRAPGRRPWSPTHPRRKSAERGDLVPLHDCAKAEADAGVKAGQERDSRGPLLVASLGQRRTTRVLRERVRTSFGSRLGLQIFSRRRSVRQLRSPPVERDDPHREFERASIERLSELGDSYEIVA